MTTQHETTPLFAMPAQAAPVRVAAAALDTASIVAAALQPSTFVFRASPDTAEVMRLDHTGMTYKGQRIEDGGEAHRAFMEVMDLNRAPHHGTAHPQVSEIMAMVDEMTSQASWDGGLMECGEMRTNIQEAIRAALTRPDDKAQPVAWRRVWPNGKIDYWNGDSPQNPEIVSGFEPLYAAPQPPVDDKAQPVTYQFQDRDGVWRPFMNEQHYKNTVADGTWPIRALYTSPQPPAEQPFQPDWMDYKQGLADGKAEAEQGAELTLPKPDCPNIWGGAYSEKQVRAIIAASKGAELSDAARDVVAERQRQVSVEGWTPEHDDEHTEGEMALAAACYALAAGGYAKGKTPPIWPWALAWWKPTHGRKDLVRAGALILAEIERLDRAARGGAA